MITCCVCNTDYKPMTGFEHTMQCFRCAAVIVERGNDLLLFGYYGSQVADGKIYRLAKDRKVGPGYVCDDCIEKMLANKTMTCISESNFFGRG